MKRYIYIMVFIFIFTSCKYEKPAYRFSNFYGTSAENIAKAIEEEDIKIIRKEILQKKVNVDFEDEKYEVSLLTLALANNKKKAFEELLNLGANPNIENKSCISPLISAIRNNKDCDLFFIKKLLNNGASINPEFFKKCNYFTNDPIVETINYYIEEKQIKCGLEILKVLASKFNKEDLLYIYNDSRDYQANVVYNCLSTHKNLIALKYLIVDLRYKVPEKIFIDGTVLLNNHGFKSLREILESNEFVFNNSPYREKAKKEILKYLKKSN